MRIADLFSLGYVPDAVINLDGFNEVTVPCRTEPQDPSPPPPRAAQVKAWPRGPTADLDILAGCAPFASVHAEVERALQSGSDRSSILGSLSLRRVRPLERAVRAAPGGARRDERQFRGRPTARWRRFRPGSRGRDQRRSDHLVRSSLSIDASCRARGVEYLHVLQSTINDEGSKPLSQEELALDRGPDAWRAGPRMATRACASSARSSRSAVSDFLDAERCLPGDGGHDLHRRLPRERSRERDAQRRDRPCLPGDALSLGPRAVGPVE